MQGELSEIDIRSILQLVELGQRTGELYVEAYSSPWFGSVGDRSSQHSSANPSWFVFFSNGSVIYAADGSSPTLARLRDHLCRYRLEHALTSISIPAIATNNAPEYGHLWMLLEQHTITPKQGRSIVERMVRETLFDLLSLHQGSFIFEIGPSLAPQLTSFSIDPLVGEIMKQVQEWNQLSPHILSPNQCPIIISQEEFQATFKHPKAVNILQAWTNGQTSIRQIARYLNRDIVVVGKALHPYIQRGVVQLISPASEFPNSPKFFHGASADRVPRVVCIDDGLTLRKTVEDILSRNGYEVTAIGNPLKALGLVFQLKPNLILCDIAMPELDGYEICAMLRKSTAFRQIPIVMLTGKDGFIDRVKARMVGATDYLTKPFGESELLMLIEKYVGLGKPNRENPNTLLAEALKDELEIDSSTSSAPSP